MSLSIRAKTPVMKGSYKKYIHEVNTYCYFGKLPSRFIHASKIYNNLCRQISRHVNLIEKYNALSHPGNSVDTSALTYNKNRHVSTTVETRQFMHLNQNPILAMHPICPHRYEGTIKTWITSLASHLSHTGLGPNLATLEKPESNQMVTVLNNLRSTLD